jgi:hypothetical protein
VRRLHERRVVYPSSTDASDSSFRLSAEHHSGPLVPGLDWINQYKKLKLESLVLRCDSTDSCVQVKNVGPIVVKNILLMESKEVVLVCQQFEGRRDLFTFPLASSFVGIFDASAKSGSYFAVQMVDVVAKCARLPASKRLSTVIPLLHNAA